MPEVVLLRENGSRWSEVRRPLPDGGGSVVVRFEPMALAVRGWALCVVESELSIVRVGVSGAAWARFSPDERVQMWLPGSLDVAPGVAVEVELSDASGCGVEDEEGDESDDDDSEEAA